MSLAYQETTLVPMSLTDLETASVFLFPFVSLVCYSFSMTGSIFLLVTYSLLKDLRTLPSRLLMSLSLAFLVETFPYCWVVPHWCSSLELLVLWQPFCFITSSWLDSVEMMRTFTAAVKLMPVLSSRSKRTLFTIYSLIDWGVPLVISFVQCRWPDSLIPLF